jgi:FAR-17a/AIG1-like protein
MAISTPSTQGDHHHDNDNHHDLDHQYSSCYRRFCDECRLAFFDLRAAPPSASTNTADADPTSSGTTRMMQLVDIPNSFSPQPKLPVLVLKFIFWSLTLSDIVVGWAVLADNPGFYLAYLTHWTLLISFLYFTLSLLNSSSTSCCLFCSSKHHHPFDDDDDENNNNNNNNEELSSVSCMVKLTWVLFTVSAHAEILVTLLFWLLVYDNDSAISYPTIMSHGVILLLVVIDGLVINRIPIRIKHFLFCCLYYLFYILWSIVHSFTAIENPDTEDNSSHNAADDTNTDADTTSIYAALDWDGDDITTTIITVVLALGVASPILFMLLWFLALYNPRTCRLNGSNRKCIIKWTMISVVVADGVVPAVEEAGHTHKSTQQIEARGSDQCTDASAFTQ